MTRIPVTVLTGFLGSGKTTLLNRLVREPAYARAAVVINEFGDIGVDHHLVRGAEGRIALVEGGCICCTASGGVADALRDLFMAAVRRQVPPFGRVLVESTGLAGPAPLLFTLRHDPFLAERYAYRGAIAVADALHLPRQLRAQPEAAQQIALADAVAISKADLCEPAQVEAAREAVLSINPGAAVTVLRPGGLDASLLGAPRAGAAPAQDEAAQTARWLAAFARVGRGAPHAGVSHAVLDLPGPVSRPAFLAGMDAVQARHGEALLRVKGLVRFAGEDGVYAVHGVHRQLYPLEPPAGEASGASSRLVFITRGARAQDVLADAAAALGRAG